MSHRAFVDFLAALNRDKALQDKVSAIAAGDQGEAVQRLVAVARAAGYSFAEHEIDELFLSLAAKEAGGELTATELEAVAGGIVAEETLTLNAVEPSTTDDFDLEYLALEQKTQSDNRQFTLLSNIMKTKHDTAKNAINNVR